MKIRLEKNTLALLLLPALSLGAMSAQAGTITFEGEVTTQSCTYDINGSADALIILDSVLASTLANDGATSPIQQFDINISDCSNITTQGNYDTHFYPLSEVEDGDLDNELPTGSTTATNVGFRLYSGAGNNRITLAGLNTQTIVANSITKDATSPTGSGQFGVSYVAKGGAATPGLVKARAQYVVRYN